LLESRIAEFVYYGNEFAQLVVDESCAFFVGVLFLHLLVFYIIDLVSDKD